MNPTLEHGKSEARREVCSNCNPPSSAKEVIFHIQEVREREKKAQSKTCFENIFGGIRSVRIVNLIQTAESELWSNRSPGERREMWELLPTSEVNAISESSNPTRPSVYWMGAAGLPHVCVECETEAEELRHWRGVSHLIKGRVREKWHVDDICI